MIKISLVPDIPEQLNDAFEQALRADLALICGGMSIGEKDFAKQLLKKMGVEENADKIRDMVGERIYRIYRLWLVCSSTAFYRGGLGLYQVLLQKFSIKEGRYDNPSTRESIYT